MSTGYIRQDTGNSIANGNVADANILDNEFNAVQDAFNSSTGHSHDGTAANGSPITKVGPTQDIVVTGVTALPKTDNTLSLGSGVLAYKDLWVKGTSTLSTLVATTADVNGGTIDGTIIGGTTPAAVTGTTITANTGLVGPVTTSNATITGGSVNSTPIGNTTPSTIVGTTITANTGFSGPLTSSAVTITGGTISGITDLAVADGGTGASTAANARTNLGVAIGSNVQAYSPYLDDLAVISPGANGAIPYKTTSSYAGTAAGTQGQVLTFGPSSVPTWARAPVNLASQGLVGGASYTFTDIPSDIFGIDVVLRGVSLTSGTANIHIQLGNSGGLVSSGYECTAYTPSTSATYLSTSSFIVPPGGITDRVHGILTLRRSNSSNILWIATYTGVAHNAAEVSNMAGFVTTTTTTDRISINTSANGTFDAGSAYISYM